MLKSVSFLSFFICIALTCNVSFAGEIKFSTLEWPPFISKKMKDMGPAAQITKEAMKRIGHESKIDFMSWSRALKLTELGNYFGTVCAWPSPEREKTYILSEPLFINRMVFVKRNDDTWSYNGIPSLKDKTVATLKNYAYTKEFLDAKNYKKQQSKALKNSLLQVAHNRADLTLEDELVLRHTLNTEVPELKDKISIITDKPLSEAPCQVAISRKWPDSQKIANAFNQAVKEMHKDGSIKKILESHGL